MCLKMLKSDMENKSYYLFFQNFLKLDQVEKGNTFCIYLFIYLFIVNNEARETKSEG